MLRASGVKWDLRKVDHYECYDDFDWEICTEAAGDCLARYVVRIREMRESVKILYQALKGLPGGSYENLEAKRLESGPKSEWNGFDYQFIGKKVRRLLRFPRANIMSALKAARVSWGFILSGMIMCFLGAGRFGLGILIICRFCLTLFAA